MSKGLKITLTILGVFFALVLVVAGTMLTSYISAVNDGAVMEGNIVMLNKDSENKLSNYTMKIQEKVQIPAMYVKDLKEVIRATFEGRYGADGSKAVMQWIQEQNIQFDSSLYKDLQVTIESGRDEFRISQTLKLQACRDYKVQLNTFWKGMWLKFAGYPKENLTDVCKVVSDSRTSEIFKTGTQEALKLN